MPATWNWLVLFADSDGGIHIYDTFPDQSSAYQGLLSLVRTQPGIRAWLAEVRFSYRD